MASRLDIKDMREIAQLKGGKCQSKEYIDSSTPLKWMCKKGHTWDAAYYNIKRGSWCAQCVRDEIKEEYLEEIKQIAKSKGGKCLSDVYENNYTHLKFQCKNGHVWMANSNNIKTGWWCPHCSGVAKRSLKEFQEIAKQKGGKCLSTVYVNVDTKLKWQCREGHEWMATAYSVEKKTWCPVCSHHVRRTIEDMKKLAKSKGGKCLSLKYDPDAKLKWQCAEGHVWFAKAGKISFGQWCRVCGNANAAKNRRVNFKVYLQLAKEHKGKVLSKEKDYVNANTPMKWQCRYGHLFTTRPAYIKNSGSWCPTCAGKKKYTIENMQLLAEAHQGKCLSLKYVSNNFRLKWQCHNGHKWMAVPTSIIRGSWCQQCYFQRKTLTKI